MIDPKGSHMKTKTKTFTLVVLALLLAVSAAICDSKYNLQVTKYSLTFPNLPPEFDGTRIVHLSDLHGSRFGKNNRRLVDAVLSLDPDIIALTGDMVSSAEELGPLTELLDGIAGAAPTYFVNGNHEWAGRMIDSVEALMAQYGVRCLRNEYEPLYVAGTGAHIIVCGVDDPAGRADMKKPDALAEDLSNDYPGDFVLWFAHRNDYIQLYPSIPVDLVLCGHAHGGIIRLPFVGGLLNVHRRLGAEYETGLYHGDRFVMEVSRGLGNSVFIPRLFNRPELVCLELHCE